MINWWDFSNFQVRLNPHLRSRTKDQESSDIVEKLANLKKEEKDRVKQINSLEHEIVKLQAEASKPPPPDLPNEEHVREELKQLNLEKSAVGSRIDEFNRRMVECTNKKAAFKADYDLAEKRCGSPFIPL